MMVRKILQMKTDKEEKWQNFQENTFELITSIANTNMRTKAIKASTQGSYNTVKRLSHHNANIPYKMLSQKQYH